MLAGGAADRAARAVAGGARAATDGAAGGADTGAGGAGGAVGGTAGGAGLEALRPRCGRRVRPPRIERGTFFTVPASCLIM